MIEVNNLTKRYGNKLAVDDISFTVKEGEIVGFLGPNGAGKSTTMNILTGYLSATAGDVKINGYDILEDPYMAKKNIGFLPEIAPLYLDMTVKEYLNFVFDLKKCTLDREKHLKDICELVSITQVYKRVIKNLSKGYKQRVGFAQALVGNPPVLILDEPTVGFDPRQIIEIRNLIKNLGKKHTVILSSHILSEIQATCQRVIVINKGKIVANDTPENLSSQMNDKKQISVIITGPPKEVQKALSESNVFKSVVIDEQTDGQARFILEYDNSIQPQKALFAILSKRDWNMLELKNFNSSLENIFMEIIEKENDAEGEKKDNESSI